MAKIDVYLRSIERFGATGAVLTSGQPVTLRFPTGDRHATQVTPHDQLVALVREVAPQAVVEQVDRSRPARFEIESGGVRYALSVQPRPGVWQVAIELAAGSAPAAAPSPAAAASSPAAAPAPSAARFARPGTSASEAEELPIERGQYAGEAGAAPARSGSTLLDQLTAAARQARASDLYLAAGSPPSIRVAGELHPASDRGSLDAETISRELGIVAPAEARAAWTERGVGLFTYGDGIGRVRVTLSRDHRGPCASLRLLAGEPPALGQLGLPREVGPWLDRKGLVLVAGPSGCGKTTTLAALVRALGEKRRRVVAFEDPIEIVHVSPLVSQRAVGEHVPGIAAGVASAMREGADAIVIGAVEGGEAAAAVIDAVAAGHLVIAALAVDSAREASVSLVDLVAAEHRDRARAVLGRDLLGTLSPVSSAGTRSFEVVAGRVE